MIPPFPSPAVRPAARTPLVAGVLALLMTVSSASPAAARERAQTGWYVVQADRFKLFTNLDRRKASELGREIEQLETILTLMFARSPRSGGSTTQVVAFRDAETFRSYGISAESKTLASVAGFYSSTPFGDFIVVDASPGNDVRQITQHEQTHRYLNRTRGEIDLWLNEGLAEYLGTARVKGDRILMGTAIDHHLERLAEDPLLPLDSFLEMTAASEGFDEAHRVGLFHAQAWLLVHFLLHDGGGRPWSAARLLELEEDPDDATVLDALGWSAQELGARLREYADRASFDTFALPRVDKGDSPRIRPAGRVAVLTRLGELAAFVLEDTARAEKLFRAALEIVPSRSGPNAGLGYLLELKGLHEQAGAHFDRAMADGSDDARVSLLRGYALLQRFEALSDTVFVPGDRPDPLLLRARIEFAKSIEAAPGLAEAHAGMGATYLYDGGDPARGIASLQRARELLPYRTDYAANLALLHAYAGEFRSSRALMAWVERRSRDRELVDRTRQLLILADREAVADLVRQGRWDDARDAVAELIDAAEDPRMRRNLETALQDVVRAIDAATPGDPK